MYFFGYLTYTIPGSSLTEFMDRVRGNIVRRRLFHLAFLQPDLRAHAVVMLVVSNADSRAGFA